MNLNNNYLKKIKIFFSIGKPVIQVYDIDKGYILFTKVNNNGEIITNKLCQVSTFIN
jgi:hypothetical protein